jgi:hypothetical protein
MHMRKAPAITCTGPERWGPRGVAERIFCLTRV